MSASCFSFVSNFRQVSQPKLPIFECGTEQRSDLNNNFWLDFLTARAYVARTICKNKGGCLPAGLITTYTSWHLGLVRLIKISNKFFEKILGDWTISKAKKPVIKFGEKGKRPGKTSKVVKTCSRNRLVPSHDCLLVCSRKRKTFAVNYTQKKIAKPDFPFSGQDYALLLINAAQR